MTCSGDITLKTSVTRQNDRYSLVIMVKYSSPCFNVPPVSEGYSKGWKWKTVSNEEEEVKVRVKMCVRWNDRRSLKTFWANINKARGARNWFIRGSWNALFIFRRKGHFSLKRLILAIMTCPEKCVQRTLCEQIWNKRLRDFHTESLCIWWWGKSLGSRCCCFCNRLALCGRKIFSGRLWSQVYQSWVLLLVCFMLLRLTFLSCCFEDVLSANRIRAPQLMRYCSWYWSIFGNGWVYWRVSIDTNKFAVLAMYTSKWCKQLRFEAVCIYKRLYKDISI